uniref:IMS import disulfide relay-system CHCH-CHCH-like Cx9C domain-containing protein n=1 Tax=Spongospora subterranea TaxID=70186 RepID=A0A0H5R1U5_9EUKA|eukprot:CRZ07897.1 hypothetical protein [Spongospora subterranea]
MAKDGDAFGLFDATPYPELLAAASLFEVKCAASRAAYCQCKQQTPAPGECASLGKELVDDHKKQLDAMKSSSCSTKYDELVQCLTSSQFKFSPCMKLQKLFRDCITELN